MSKSGLDKQMLEIDRLLHDLWLGNTSRSTVRKAIKELRSQAVQEALEKQKAQIVERLEDLSTFSRKISYKCKTNWKGEKSEEWGTRVWVNKDDAIKCVEDKK